MHSAGLADAVTQKGTAVCTSLGLQSLSVPLGRLLVRTLPRVPPCPRKFPLLPWPCPAQMVVAFSLVMVLVMIIAVNNAVGGRLYWALFVVVAILEPSTGWCLSSDAQLLAPQLWCLSFIALIYGPQRNAST